MTLLNEEELTFCKSGISAKIKKIGKKCEEKRRTLLQINAESRQQMCRCIFAVVLLGQPFFHPLEKQEVVSVWGVISQPYL